MTVAKLIEQLKKCPQDLQVLIYYDGSPRLSCDGAFISNDVWTWDEEGYKTQSTGLVLCETADVYNSTSADIWMFKKESGDD